MATSQMSCGQVNFEIPAHVSAGAARSFRGQVTDALQRGTRSVVVNCETWTQLDFSMLSSLIRCAAACREHGADFAMANLPTRIHADVRALNLHSRLGLEA